MNVLNTPCKEFYSKTNVDWKGASGERHGKRRKMNLQDSPQPQVSTTLGLKKLYISHPRSFRRAQLHLLVKDKSGTQSAISPVHPASNDTEQRLAINQYPDTILLDNLVKLAAWWWHIVKVVSHTGTATRLYRDSQKTGFCG